MVASQGDDVAEKYPVQKALRGLHGVSITMHTNGDAFPTLDSSAWRDEVPNGGREVGVQLSKLHDSITLPPSGRDYTLPS